MPHPQFDEETIAINITASVVELAPRAFRPMSFAIKGKHVLITGASRGIGRACVKEFHAAGAQITAAARNAQQLEQLSEELGRDRVNIVGADVTVACQRQHLLDAGRRQFGDVDVLVNNAGWAAFGTVQRLPLEHVEQMVALNLTSPIALTKEVLPPMLDRNSGQIINISSVVGIQPIPRMTVYSATKCGLTGFSTGLRMELMGSGVDVINIAPSSTRTDFFDAAASVDAKATRIAKTQYSPERVAKAVLRASRRRSREVTLSLEGNAIALIRRFSHRIADAIMYQVGKRGMPPT